MTRVNAVHARRPFVVNTAEIFLFLLDVWTFHFCVFVIFLWFDSWLIFGSILRQMKMRKKSLGLDRLNVALKTLNLFADGCFRQENLHFYFSQLYFRTFVYISLHF